MMLTIALAVLVSQAEAEPNDGMSSHVLNNIKSSLKGATAAALVTVAASPPKGRAKLTVTETVFGELPSELEVAVSAFSKRDLEPGTQLLVFFRGRAPTGHYELVWEDQIRQYPVPTYVTRVRYEAAKPKPKPAPAAPISSAARLRPAGS